MSQLKVVTALNTGSSRVKKFEFSPRRAQTVQHIDSLVLAWHRNEIDESALAKGLIDIRTHCQTKEEIWHYLNAIEKIPSGLVPGMLVIGTALRLMRSSCASERAKAYIALANLTVNDKDSKADASRILKSALARELHSVKT